MKTIPYTYKNCPVPGGGYVTGFLFHPGVENILYARTDIGGIYRYNQGEQAWECLIDHVTEEDLSETYPLSFAVNADKPNMLYSACGTFRGGYLAVSRDRGTHFQLKPLPVTVHGNSPGRSTGERLLCKNDILYFASQTGGLLHSRDEGDTWESLPVPNNGQKESTLPTVEGGHQRYYKQSVKNNLFPPPAGEKNLTFIWGGDPYGRLQLPDDFFIVGTSGEAFRAAYNQRGCSLYYSLNGCKSFEPLPYPSPLEDIPEDSYTINGFVPQRICADDTYVYVTFLMTGKSDWIDFNCYSADTSSVIDGRIYRYHFSETGELLSYRDITPAPNRLPDGRLQPVTHAVRENYNGKHLLHWGMGGVDATDGKLLCTTVGNHLGDIIWLSPDRGETWQMILQGIKIGTLLVDVPYMKPEYNGGTTMVHWVSDIKIDPHHSNIAYFNTGTGIFRTENLNSINAAPYTCSDAPVSIQSNASDDDSKYHSPVIFRSFCKGLEETVHLGVYSVPSGEVQVLDMIGDLGGFAFTDLDTPCENSFANENGDRYITCLNGDFADCDTNTIAVTPRGNWTGKTKGGVILTHDQCKTWTLLPYPYGLSEEMDAKLEELKHPNTDSGWVALSADGKRLLWTLITRERIFSTNMTVYTDDEGAHWYKSVFYDKEGKTFEQNPQNVKIFSDRVNPHLFYAFSLTGKLYISTDKGISFYEILPSNPTDGYGEQLFRDRFPFINVRIEREKEGHAWIAVHKQGLFHMIYDVQKNEVQIERITAEGDYVKCIGIGKPKADTTNRTLFATGILNGTYGFFRSHDYGVTWEKINAPHQCFGQINSIDGDERVYGRFYLATGSKGLLYGDEVK